MTAGKIMGYSMWEVLAQDLTSVIHPLVNEPEFEDKNKIIHIYVWYQKSQITFVLKRANESEPASLSPQCLCRIRERYNKYL